MRATGNVRVDTSRLSDVEETMLISLWARAAESQRADSIVQDRLAIRLTQQLAYEFSRFERGWKTQVGVAVRTRAIDRFVQSSLRTHPDALVIHLGVGLDTRHWRIEPGRATWLDVDFPGVMQLRRELLPASPRVISHAGSILDGDWIEHARSFRAQHTLIVAEGVLMFLSPAEIERLFDALRSNFRDGMLIADCIGGLLLHCPWLHDTLPRTRASFQWSGSSRRGRAELHRHGRLLEMRPMLREHPRRWRWMRPLGHVPWIREQFVIARLHLDSFA